MVERIMLWKLLDAATRREVAELSERALSGLPGLSELSVGLPCDAASEKSWDVSIVMRFRDAAALDAALESPAFERYVEGDMAGRYAVVKAWSFAQLLQK